MLFAGLLLRAMPFFLYLPSSFVTIALNILYQNCWSSVIDSVASSVVDLDLATNLVAPHKVSQ
jgi:hypothetical protein